MSSTIDELEYFRKRMVNRESQRIIDGEEMNEDLVRLICATNDGYETPELNDKLYLHFKGFSKICNLDNYSACKSLWLESNRIAKIENISHMTLLASLFLHNNRIRKIENLESFQYLVNLNLSSNHIAKVEGLSELKRLQTLNLSKNLLGSIESLEHLAQCPTITNLDLSSNDIEDSGVLQVFKRMPELTQLYLHGNDVVKNTKHYRKTVVTTVPSLTYLDTRPIFEKERAAIEAWSQGGREAEAQAIQDYRKSQREKDQERRKKFRAWKAEQARIGAENRKAGIIAKPMVSYVNVNSDKVTAADFPPNSHYVRKGIVPLSHNSRPVSNTDDNIALYGANVNDTGEGMDIVVGLVSKEEEEEEEEVIVSGGVGEKKMTPPLPSDGGSSATIDDVDSPPSLPCASSQHGVSVPPSDGQWSAEIDSILAKLVRKHAFDFPNIAKALRKKLGKRGTQNVDFIDAESCRMRWCGLDFLKYKKSAVECSPKMTENGSETGAAPLRKSVANSPPSIPDATLGETDMDELD